MMAFALGVVAVVGWIVGSFAWLIAFDETVSNRAAERAFFVSVALFAFALAAAFWAGRIS